jgi:hypothetical protein
MAQAEPNLALAAHLGAVGTVADAGGREGAGQLDLDATDSLVEFTLPELTDEVTSGPHGADGMGARRPDTDLE